jgi:hypothetical protein
MFRKKAMPWKWKTWLCAGLEENQHFSETRSACRLSPVCSLFALRLFDERLKTKSSRNHMNYTTEHFLCMKGTNDSISELRKERAGSL